MQKKIIALAVAGLVSGAAFAQSNVTVFGIVDAGYQYNWDNVASKTKDNGKVIAGGYDGSRLGFRGTEDLGNGLKVNFEFTAGFDLDHGDSYGGRLMSEGSWVGLSGKSWGEVKAGYFGTFLDDNTGIDVTGRKGIANTGKLYDTGKWENHVAYYSPTFSGFQVKAGYSSNIGGQDNAPIQDAGYTRDVDGNINSTQNVAGYELAGSYANGGLKLGAAYAAYRPQDVNTTAVTPANRVEENGYEWNAGVSYDFKVVAVSLFGSRTVNPIGGNTSGTPNWGANANVDYRDFLALGVSVPIGTRDSIKVGYGEAKTYSRGTARFANGKDKDDATDIGILYTHNLSKRTDLYAMYGNVDSDNGLYDLGDGYKQAFNVGLNHRF
jgi:predicted porin